MECRLLLNIVVSKCLSVLELLAREDQALLIRRDALLVLNLLLHILNAVARLNIESDRLASKSLNENLHFVYSSLVYWKPRRRRRSIFWIFFNFLIYLFWLNFSKNRYICNRCI